MVAMPEKGEPEMISVDDIESLGPEYQPTILEMLRNATDADYETYAELALERSEDVDRPGHGYPHIPEDDREI